MKTDNPNCDGAGPHSDNQEVRKYPLGDGANLILCLACVGRENRHRAQRRANGVDWPHQEWDTLHVCE